MSVQDEFDSYAKHCMKKDEPIARSEFRTQARYVLVGSLDWFFEDGSKSGSHPVRLDVTSSDLKIVKLSGFGGATFPMAVSLSGTSTSLPVFNLKVLRPLDGTNAFPVKIDNLPLPGGDSVSTQFEAPPLFPDGMTMAGSTTTKNKKKFSSGFR